MLLSVKIKIRIDLMKIISELQKQAIRDMYDKLGYSLKQIEEIFHKGSISKPTIIKILHKNNLIEKKVAVEEDFHDSDVTIESKLSSMNESEETKISEVESANSVENDELKDIVYTDWELFYCEEFLTKHNSSLGYSDKQLMDLANTMVKAGKEKKITATQIITVADELLKNGKTLNYRNFLVATDICKKHNLI